MGKLFSGAILLGLAAGTAVFVYAQRRSSATGRDIGAVLSNLPRELRESSEMLKKNMDEAAAVGRRAAAEREAEIERQLEGDELDQEPQTPITDYVV